MTRASRCTCLDGIGLNTTSVPCPKHPNVVDLLAPDLLIPDLPKTPPGRVHHAEPVMLRPAGIGTAHAQTALHELNAKVRASTMPCSCDAPAIFGHDTGCEHHPAPILADPMQLLVAAIQLISDQPTTEQWHIIKKAIADLVPSPFRSA